MLCSRVGTLTVTQTDLYTFMQPPSILFTDTFWYSVETAQVNENDFAKQFFFFYSEYVEYITIIRSTKK